MNGLRDRGDNRREEQLAKQGQCLLVIRSAIMIKGKVVIAYIYLGHRYTLNTFFGYTRLAYLISGLVSITSICLFSYISKKEGSENCW
jgi:hypothetical protein